MRKIYCSNCGQMIPENSNYCRYCGAPQHGPEAATYQIQSPTRDHFDAPSFMIQHAQNTDHPKKADTKKNSEKERSHTFKNHKLAGAARFVFLISYVAKTAPILLLLAIGAFFDPLIFGILLAGYFLLLTLIAFAVHDSFRFTIDENGFEKEYGIIHTQNVSIPFRQIENVNIIRTTADMLLGLARINIETAGSAASAARNVVGGSSSNAEGHLPGVTLKDAKKIHDLLIERMSASKD